jgi:signal transduction histidine kinase
MTLKAYLKDKVLLFIMYFVLMVFVLGMVTFISIDHTSSNVLYVAFVLLFLLVIYLSIDYLKISSYFKAIDQKVVDHSMEWIPNLPEPISSVTEKYEQYVLKAYKTAQNENEQLILQHKENIEFVNTWVHEIKVPVAAAKLVISNSIDAPNRDVLISVNEEIEKIETFVEQVLYYSKINDFSKDYLIASTNMEPLIKESVKRYKKQFIAKRISIEFGNNDYTIDTDKKWLAYIIDQLLSNALKYTNEFGKIKINMKEVATEYQLAIIDNGVGIRKDEMKRVFERGFTGTTGRLDRSSTGLGLYMAQSLATKLGLSITVSSQLEKGSTFTIHFPKWES